MKNFYFVLVEIYFFNESFNGSTLPNNMIDILKLCRLFFVK